MYFNVNFSVFFKLIKVHLLVRKLYILIYHFLSLRCKHFLSITAVRSPRSGVVLECDTVPLSEQFLTCWRTVTPSSSDVYNARCDGLTAAMLSSSIKCCVVGSALPEISKKCRVLHLLGLLDTAHEANVTLVITGNYPLRNTMSHPTILELSLTFWHRNYFFNFSTHCI